MRTFAISLLFLALTGCALAPAPERDEIRKQALPNTAVPAQWTAVDGATSAVANDWLAAFGDPQLDALVKEAIIYNVDLRAAAARVDQAAGYLQAAGAILYP